MISFSITSTLIVISRVCFLGASHSLIIVHDSVIVI